MKRCKEKYRAVKGHGSVCEIGRDRTNAVVIKAKRSSR